MVCFEAGSWHLGFKKARGEVGVAFGGGGGLAVSGVQGGVPKMTPPGPVDRFD